MVSFAILFFFALTGITLNHPDWFFNESQSTQSHSGTLDLKLLNVAGSESNAVKDLEIVEHFRTRHQLRGALENIITDEFQCVVSFKGPGYSADAFIDRETGEYTLDESSLGFVPLINDLHKGRDSGPIWSLVIDLSAVLMVLVSLSGTALILFLKRYRVSGLIILCGGAIVAFLVYFYGVP